MILTNVTLTNFGIFRGCQRVNLSPRPRRPVILFGGKNGAGKSTLLGAIQLCLYGQGVLGARSSREEYFKYLDGKIHSNPTCLIQPAFASVALEFQYGTPDGLSTFTVTRSWERRNGGRTVEDLSVERDRKPLDDIGSDHWQDFVRELIPPGVSQLFFFDGERIQHLAENTTDQQTLAEAIKSLLGLDIVERLQGDLRICLSRLVKPSANGQHAREITELEHSINQLKQEIEKVNADRAHDETKIVELKSLVAGVENQISLQGGAFARNREQLVRKQGELNARIHDLEASLREFCGDILPFAFVFDLCLQLKKQLLTEDRIRQIEVSRALLESAGEQISKRIRDTNFWKDLPPVPKRLRLAIQDRLNQLASDALKVDQTLDAEVVHDLSASETRKLLSWIEQALDIYTPVRRISIELERSYHDLHQTAEALQKIPAQDVLKPLLDELHTLHQRLAAAGKSALLKDEAANNMQHQLAELQRRYDAAADKLAAEASSASRIHMIPKVQHVLEDFGSALIDRKVSELQGAVTQCFNALCRKKDHFRRLTVNPKDYSVTLFDKRNQPIPKGDLSAGEKQIYAISMLWALARTSGRPLPMIIDTPLARLDSEHRTLLIEHYFPVASHQVMILSTDTEVDRTYFNRLRPAVAHSYRLEFNAEENSTMIQPGYFWEEDDASH